MTVAIRGLWVLQGDGRDRVAVLISADLHQRPVEGNLNTGKAVPLLADYQAGVGQVAANVAIGEVGEDGISGGLLCGRAGGARLYHLP